MKKAWLSALLNFFFMGPGYIYNGRRVALGIGFTLGAFLLTYVEMNLQASLKPEVAYLYWVMFGTVFLINTCFAIDGYQEAQAINAKPL